MYSHIFFPRQWPRIASICRTATTIEGQKLPQNSSSSDGISPPVRIPRGPTDILQALSATVGADPTAAHYKYHDDPYLIPLSNFRKRSYALSAEAGRKAAAWVRDEHANLFTTREWDPPGKLKTPHFNAEPHIDAFYPRPIYNDESKVTIEDFQYTLKNALIDDSIKVYELLGGVQELSEELKIEFLQLLCFYNEKEPLSMEWLEERWFATNTRERQGATWKLGGLADTIFTSMDPKTSQAYCALIQGMAKYYQAERAHALAKEALENGITLSTDVYNSLLSCVGFLKEGTALRIEALKSLLIEMQEQGLSPNQGTLTACLRSISAWGGGRILQQIALQIVSEFRAVGIQPGLSAYYNILCLFCKERGPRIDILSSILNDLETRPRLEPKDATDTNFFITAMGVCSDHLQDIALAERLHKLVMKDDNYKLLGDAYKESIYYRHYITVSCRQAPFEKTLELLDTLVPNIYVPEPSVMEEAKDDKRAYGSPDVKRSRRPWTQHPSCVSVVSVGDWREQVLGKIRQEVLRIRRRREWEKKRIIKTLELGGAGDRLAQAWSQLVVFGHANRTRLVERLLEAFCNCYQLQDNEVKAKIRAAAGDILKFGQLAEEKEESGERRSPVQKLSASALTNIIELCSDGPAEENGWERVEQALERLRDERAVGVPSRPEVLASLAPRAAAVGKPALAATAVAYLVDCGFEEATTASVSTLSVMLNRPAEEVQTLLQEDRNKLVAALHPSALVLADAYHAAKTGSQMHTSDSSTSSDSDGESSDDD